MSRSKRPLRLTLISPKGPLYRKSGIFGEKLTEEQAGRAIARAFDGEPVPSFALLAPEGNRYALFVDRRPGDPAALLARLTAALRTNPAFAYAQDLGQLGPLRLVLVPPDAGRRFVACRYAAGGVLGAVKPTRLADEGAWSERLGGLPLDGAEPGPEAAA